MSKSLKRVQSVLEQAGIAAPILEMRGETRTAQQAADQVGCALDQIAKSIIFRGGTTDQAVLFVTAGGNQVDPELARHLAGQDLHRADAAFVRETTGFAIGGVAPVGHVTAPICYFDPRLLAFELVYAAAGTPRHLFGIAPPLLAALCCGQQGAFVRL